MSQWICCLHCHSVSLPEKQDSTGPLPLNLSNVPWLCVSCHSSGVVGLPLRDHWQAFTVKSCRSWKDACVCENTLTTLLSLCEYINSFTTFEVAKPKYLPLHIFNIYDDESKYCHGGLSDTERSSSGLGWRGQGGNVIGVCVCVWGWRCVCSPERAGPHHRGGAHCCVCSETHMQIRHGSANNLHEFVYYGFMSWNLNLSSKKDRCVDETVLEWACGLRGGWGVCLCVHLYVQLVTFTSAGVPAYIFACKCVRSGEVIHFGDSFTSWSQIWISPDEILFPLDWSPSPLIPAQEPHD